MPANNAMGTAMDFNRFGPSPVAAPTGQPFAAQNPNMAAMPGMNGPAPPFNPAGRPMAGGPMAGGPMVGGQQNRFNNNANRNFQPHGGNQKRMRRY